MHRDAQSLTYQVSERINERSNLQTHCSSPGCSNLNGCQLPRSTLDAMEITCGCPTRAADPGDTVTRHWFTWWGEGVSAGMWLSLTQTLTCHREDSIRGRRGMTGEKRACGQNPAAPSALQTGSATAPDLPALHQLHPAAPPTAGPELPGAREDRFLGLPRAHFQASHFQAERLT